MPARWWWIPENTGDVTYDYSGNKADADFLGTPSWVSSPDGPALFFDGVSAGLSCGFVDITTWNSVSVFCRFKSSASTGRRIFSITYSGGDDIRLYMGSSTSIIWAMDDGSVVNTTATIAQNTWHNVVATHDGVKLRLYVDGHEIDVQNDTFNYAGTNGATWIANFNSTAYLEGSVSCVGLFPTAFTSSQVATLSQNPFGLVRQPRRVALWHAGTGAPPAVSIPVFMHHYMHH